MEKHDQFIFDAPCMKKFTICRHSHFLLTDCVEPPLFTLLVSLLFTHNIISTATVVLYILHPLFKHTGCTLFICFLCLDNNCIQLNF